MPLRSWRVVAPMLFALMRQASWLLLIGMLAASQGCTVMYLAKRTIKYEPRDFDISLDEAAACKQYMIWAEQEWGAYLDSAPDVSVSPSFEQGFREGFVDVVFAGGDGDPPPIPPRRFWKTMYRNPQGDQTIHDWTEGFRAGAGVARDKGYRRRALVPSIDKSGAKPDHFERARNYGHDPQGPPPFSNEVLDGDHTTELTPSRPVQNDTPLQQSDAAVIESPFVESRFDHGAATDAPRSAPLRLTTPDNAPPADVTDRMSIESPPPKVKNQATLKFNSPETPTAPLDLDTLTNPFEDEVTHPMTDDVLNEGDVTDDGEVSPMSPQKPASPAEDFLPNDVDDFLPDEDLYRELFGEPDSGGNQEVFRRDPVPSDRVIQRQSRPTEQSTGAVASASYSAPMGDATPSAVKRQTLTDGRQTDASSYDKQFLKPESAAESIGSEIPSPESSHSGATRNHDPTQPARREDWFITGLPKNHTSNRTNAASQSDRVKGHAAGREEHWLELPDYIKPTKVDRIADRLLSTAPNARLDFDEVAATPTTSHLRGQSNDGPTAEAFPLIEPPKELAPSPMQASAPIPLPGSNQHSATQADDPLASESQPVEINSAALERDPIDAAEPIELSQSHPSPIESQPGQNQRNHKPTHQPALTASEGTRQTSRIPDQVTESKKASVAKSNRSTVAFDPGESSPPPQKKPTRNATEEILRATKAFQGPDGLPTSYERYSNMFQPQ